MVLYYIVRTLAKKSREQNEAAATEAELAESGTDEYSGEYNEENYAENRAENNSEGKTAPIIPGFAAHVCNMKKICQQDPAA